MKKEKRNWVSAVIVAAGRGTRMNMEQNKQFIEVAGKPVLAHTIQVFQECEEICEIVLVANTQDIIFCKQQIVEPYGFPKVTTIVAGGDERQKSVYNGLVNVSSSADIVLIHDGARPFITGEVIARCIEGAEESYGCTAAVPVKDTIKVADASGYVAETPDRSTLWAVQTPQAFQYRCILDAHRKAAEEGFLGTDDGVLLERMGNKLRLVMGSYENIKITTREDLLMAEAILHSREETIQR